MAMPCVMVRAVRLPATMMAGGRHDARGAASSASGPSPPVGRPPQAKRILCVASCKGGVGKSTVALNVSAALAMRGQRVGILDMDIYGPSLPSLLPPLREKEVY